MKQNLFKAHWPVKLMLAACACIALPHAHAASCTTQSQMTAAQRDALASASKAMVAQVQTGDVLGLKANTLPAVAADFNGIQALAVDLKPALQQAALTVDEVYLLDATSQAADAQRTDFFCGSPVVVLNFTGLPAGMYALAIVHATGVPNPQQIALILSRSPNNQWLLGGLYAKAMTAAGHDGVWYWTSARRFAQTRMNWDAWFYYQLATNLLNPLDFLSSPNLEKLHHETDQVRPGGLPGTTPMLLAGHGATYSVTALDPTTALGPLDLDLHYTPDAAQAAQLRDPTAARAQVTSVMAALLELHPELHDAFHGVWVHADQGNATLFALELPMSGNGAGMQPANSVVR